MAGGATGWKAGPTAQPDTAAAETNAPTALKMRVYTFIRASVVVRYSHPHDVKSPSSSDSKGVRNDRSNRVRSGLPKCWRAADNTIAVQQKLSRKAWSDFRCHVRREVLDLA